MISVLHRHLLGSCKRTYGHRKTIYWDGQYYLQMPSAEFIGKIEDLNEKYDMSLPWGTDGCYEHGFFW